MSWVASLSRKEQVGLYVTHLLNRCKILPDGAELKAWVVEELGKIQPEPTKEEIDIVLYAMYVEGVKFQGQQDSVHLFAAEPMFLGSSLGVPSGNVA